MCYQKHAEHWVDPSMVYNNTWATTIIIIVTFILLPLVVECPRGHPYFIGEVSDIPSIRTCSYNFMYMYTHTRTHACTHTHVHTHTHTRTHTHTHTHTNTHTRTHTYTHTSNKHCVCICTQCGRAVEEKICPVCGSRIGGERCILQPDNKVARQWVYIIYLHTLMITHPFSHSFYFKDRHYRDRLLSSITGATWNSSDSRI